MPEVSSESLRQLLASRDALNSSYAAFKEKKLALDMTRGKPCAEQLDLALGLLTVLTEQDWKSKAGEDCRNYGSLDGLAETKELLAPLLGVSTKEIIVGGNSSLSLMHDVVARGMSHGFPGSLPWSAQGKVKFLCPAPGYDRHFAICAHFGIEMITVEMDEQGPDMAVVERLLASDASIKGIWLVPRFGNPTGYTLSDAVVQRLAAMKVAAADFRIFWDNAYAVHTLSAQAPEVKNILEACKAAGNPDRPLLFGSTSKISFAGAGIAVMGGSEANMAWMRSHLSLATIGPDKINQLRHVRFFKDWNGLLAHMEKHAAIIKPKFDAVERVLKARLGALGIATWTQPLGGYFVSFDTPDGCAKRSVELAAAAGVKLTSAGATYPLGKDPADKNIRIAPTLPNVTEIETAMEVFAVCVQLAALERLS
jgi:DNA-binding transcriptional MocR family regulator